MYTSDVDQTVASKTRRHFSFGLWSKLLILVIALFMVACAGATTAAKITPTPTPTFISTSGNNLVTVVNQKQLSGSVRVNVTEVEYAIVPSITTFHAGVSYYFVVSNKGKMTHAFTFVPTYANGTPMDEYYQYDHMLVGLNTIPPGTTQTINYTFTTSDIGHYEMACRMRGHYMAGMHLPVLVV